MQELKIFSTFSGIGAFEKALDRIGAKYDLEGYCEIDKYASKAYALIHNTEEWMNYGDITKIDESLIPKDLDLFTYGFPCQDISLAGNQKGLVDEKGNKTRSGLVWDATRIIKASQPKVAIAENVKNLVSNKFTKEFEAILAELEVAGYNNYWKVLNAKEHGIAQNRERVFIVSIRKDIDLGLFEWPEKEELKTRLLDYLEDQVDENYYLSDKMIRYISQSGTKNFRSDTKINLEVARPLTTEHSKRAGTTNYIAPDLPANFDLKQVGQMYGTDREPNPQAGRVYDPKGISPTLDSMQGGNRMPKIIMPEKTETTICINSKVNGKQPSVQDRIYDSRGISTAITTSYHPNVLIMPENTKKDYALAEEGDGVYLDRPHQKRGVVQKEMIQTIKTSGSDVGVVVRDTRNLKEKLCDELIENGTVKGGEVINHSYTNEKKNPNSRLTLEDYIETKDGIMPTLTTRGDTLGVVVGEHRRDEGLRTFKDAVIGTLRATDAGGDKVVVSCPPLRIRKLTPKECFRLMGFDDKDHDVVEQAGISNSQRYKMAGNSIVVNVAAKILKNIIDLVLNKENCDCKNNNNSSKVKYYQERLDL